MKYKTLTLLTAAVLFAALAIPAKMSAQEPEQQEEKKEHTRYKLIDLGPAGPSSDGINNRGWVAGTALLPDGVTVHASLWRKGVKTNLGTLGGPNSNPFSGPSARGEVVGQAETSTPDPLGEDFCGFGTHLICLPFVWQSGLMTPLSTLGGNNGSAYSVNSRGEAVGSAENTMPDPTCPPPQVLVAKPVIWEKSEIQELPTVSGDPDGVAFRINNKGQVVGASANCTTPFHAVLWQRNRHDEEQARRSDAADWTVTDLGNLGGTMNISAQGINDRGQVVGFSGLPNDLITHAFLWENDVMTDLGTLPGGDINSLAFGINNEGQVVGLSCGVNFDCVGFLWQDGVMTDLNTLIPAGSPWFLTQAYDINSRGEIVGLGELGAGVNHAFLAIPCDEEHDDAIGCKDDAETTTTQAPSSSAPKLKRAELVASPKRSLTARENVAAWRAQMLRRSYIPRLGTPKN